MDKFNKQIFIITIVMMLVIVSVFLSTTDREPMNIYQNTEARDDEQKRLTALSLQNKIGNTVVASVETKSVFSKVGEDAADDPAIWVDKENTERSLIIGTDKNFGLFSYNMKGEMIQALRAGQLNNVDLREGFYHLSRNYVLIAASNRSINAISLFLLNPESLLISTSILDIKSSVNEVYGLCMFKDESNRFFVFVNGKNGEVEQYEITSENNNIRSKLCRQLKVNSQPEGMVCNDLTADFYIGVEQEGIFRASANPEANSQLFLIDKSSETNNQNISYDIEGLAIYQTDSCAYLLASTQGNFSYAIYDIRNTEKIEYITSFTIDDGKYDGVEETDGIEITSISINKDFPKGMLVVQDGFNYDAEVEVPQNFKYISWEAIEKYLK